MRSRLCPFASTIVVVSIAVGCSSESQETDGVSASAEHRETQAGTPLAEDDLPQPSVATETDTSTQQSGAADGDASPPTPADDDQNDQSSETNEPPGRKGITVDLGDGVEMDFVCIPAGDFMMGSPEDEESRRWFEHQHHVRITKPFYLGVYEVTQAQYEKVMGENPSPEKAPNRPVENVSWHDAVEFCEKLSATDGRTFRLPTEAQWEYACRAGTTTAYFFGDTWPNLSDYAWFWLNSKDTQATQPVGGKKPNPWGLYDMYGNVQEWCADRYGIHSTDPVVDPIGPETGAARVLRGGYWGTPAASCRSASRGSKNPNAAYFGFRVSLVPTENGMPPSTSVADDPKHQSLETDKPAKREGITVDLGDGVEMDFVRIPAGKFLMGSPEDEESRSPFEHQHQVQITKPFYLGVYEVTQAQYEKVMGENPSPEKAPNRPVENVSWHDAVEFCEKLSATDGRTFRLPTEAQWEYACRAGTTTAYFFGDTWPNLSDYAWFWLNSEDTRATQPVGGKKPNPWGLYDMYGNVQEWCADRYGIHSTDPVVDPIGPETGAARVLRGGYWGTPAASCRSASRGSRNPNAAYFGFRVCLVPAK